MPTVIGGTALVEPRRASDCSCVFCGLFRAHHYWWRAAIATAVVPLLLLLTVAVDHHMRANNSPNNERSSAIGGLLLVTTGFAVIALATWYQPLRRLMHIVRPRSHDPV
jgi:hypothetical protein